MRQYLITALLLQFFLQPILSARSDRVFTDHFYLPPVSTEDSNAEQKSVSRRFTADMYLEERHPIFILEDFTDDNPYVEQLKIEAPPHQIAFGKSLTIYSNELFSGPFNTADRIGNVFLGSISSEDARAIRLKVNLKYLRQDEELYVIDGRGRAIFGPFNATKQADEDGFWLPTIFCDTVQLVLYSPRNVCPILEISTLSHFFKSIFFEEPIEILPCHLSIEKETNPDALIVAAGVGIIIVPFGDGSQGFCTGSLINSIDSGEIPPPPFFLSAGHCFGGLTHYAGIEVYWDYRSETVDRYSLERNSGATLIVKSNRYDAALIKLVDSVKAGPYGRTWIGWDTVSPVKDDRVMSFHHPKASSMKISRGIITNPEVDACLTIPCIFRFEKQIEILLQEGISEPGSSGSPLLLTEQNYRIIGMLSNGLLVTCDDTTGKLENYASFANFFTMAKYYLMPYTTFVEPVEPEYEETYTRKKCFLSRVFGLETYEIEHIYSLRDNVLSQTSLGKQLIQDYYALCPILEQWLKNDSAARVVTKGLIYVSTIMGSLF